jgi:hypothetical protein
MFNIMREARRVATTVWSHADGASLRSAPWPAVRNAAHSYGFAAFAIDPGTKRGDFTTITVIYSDVIGTDGQLAPFESFTLRRPRRD